MLTARLITSVPFWARPCRCRFMPREKPEAKLAVRLPTTLNRPVGVRSRGTLRARAHENSNE